MPQPNYEELFARYNEETDILNDTKSLAVILYGSMVNNAAHNGSDLDIFVIVPTVGPYYHREARLIDGYPIETLFFSPHSLRIQIKNDYINNRNFMESVFFKGIEKKNTHSIIESAQYLLTELKNINKEPLEHNEYWDYILDQLLYEYRRANGNYKKMYYYSFISNLRNIYHNLHNYSNITEWNCYSLYTNPKKAESYLLNLPDKKFIDTYIKALKPDNMAVSLESLYPFVGYVDYEKKGRFPPTTVEYREKLTSEQINQTLMFLGKNIYKVENLLLMDSYDADFCYFELLTFMKMKSLSIGPTDLSIFNMLFDQAINTTGGQERIEIIEKLFHEINKDYEFDYDDYSL